MPTEKGDKRSLGVWLNEDLIAKLDELANQSDVSRSKLVGYLIEEGVKFIAPYEKLGFLHLGVVLNMVRDKLMGREEKKIENIASKAMTIWVDKKLDAALDRIAKKGGMSKSRLVMNLVDSAIEDKEVWNRVGEIAPRKLFTKWRKDQKKQIDNMFEEQGLKIK